MHEYKQEFIQLCLEVGSLKFGEFTLKSGRVSPYFFNMGSFNTGKLLARLSYFYASTLQQASLNYTVIMGPAYKGIPLAATTVVALAEHYQVNKGFCFNRKEVKDHGEGGLMVGAAIANQPVIIIDDVITAGTAINQAITIIHEAKASLAGVVVAFDRQEKGSGELSAIDEIKQRYAIPVLSIINLADLLHYLKLDNTVKQHLPCVEAYAKQFGTAFLLKGE